jgi:hypothetical protein
LRFALIYIIYLFLCFFETNRDQAFSSKSEIADSVKTSLADLMDDYGYQIVNVLIVDLDPDNTVKNAMNEINGEYFSFSRPISSSPCFSDSQPPSASAWPTPTRQTPRKFCL